MLPSALVVNSHSRDSRIVSFHFTGIGSLPDDGSLICSPDKSMTSFNISESFDISEGFDCNTPEDFDMPENFDRCVVTTLDDQLAKAIAVW